MIYELKHDTEAQAIGHGTIYDFFDGSLEQYVPYLQKALSSQGRVRHDSYYFQGNKLICFFVLWRNAVFNVAN